MGGLINPKAEALWLAWRSDSSIVQFAEAWIASCSLDWSDEREQLAQWIEKDPDRALAIIFAIVQLTSDQKILGTLGAGDIENFLGDNGDAYVDIFHVLALQHKCLREVLDYVWQGRMPKKVWHRIEILKQSAFS